jgi:membrane protein DedA with SNARE-associated domain
VIAEFEAWLFGTLQTIFDSWGWMGVAAMMAFENATSLTPSEITLGLAGWLLLSNHNEPVHLVFLGALYAAVGSLVGASFNYWAARLGGRPLVEKVARWLRVDLKLVTKAENQFQRHGAKLVFFGRLIPTVRILVNIPAGLARMPYPKFALLTFSGAYLWCALLIGIGYVLGVEWTLYREIVLEQAERLLPYGVVILFILAANLFLFRDFWNRRKLRLSPVLIPLEDPRENENQPED